MTSWKMGSKPFGIPSSNKDENDNAIEYVIRGTTVSSEVKVVEKSSIPLNEQQNKTAEIKTRISAEKKRIIVKVFGGEDSLGLQ